MKSFALARAGSALFSTLLLALLFLAMTGGTAAVAAETEIVRASAKYRDSRQFYRISEFFTKRENTGRDTIVRSQPEERGGYYFTIRLKPYPYRQETVEEAIHLEVIMPGDVEPTLFTFPLGPGKRRSPLILIGLTGDDWPDPQALPLAWRIAFNDAEGNVLAQERSFLWSIEE